MVYQRSGRKNRGLCVSALLSALCAFVSFVPFLFQDGGFFHVWSDFNAQQIPFGMALHNALEGLNIGGWTWNYSTGMSTIQAFSFYALGSPFYWISLLFPVNWYPYLTGWTYILKYTVAGAAAYCYIRRFTQGENSAAAGALMYAFSAFQTTNLMYYHFHDAAALFPCPFHGVRQQPAADPFMPVFRQHGKVPELARSFPTEQQAVIAAGHAVLLVQVHDPVLAVHVPQEPLLRHGKRREPGRVLLREAEFVRHGPEAPADHVRACGQVGPFNLPDQGITSFFELTV